MKHLPCAALLLLVTGSALAQTVSLSGQMGDNKALLLIDGTPSTVAVGGTVRGVTLKRLANGQADVEVGGKTLTLGMGGASSVGSSGRGSAGGTAIVLPMGPGGHFMAQGAINGRPVQFMVDTGATSIALSASEADRIGLNWKAGQRSFSQTAGGVVPIFTLNLTAVRIGDVEVYNVGAVVLQTEMPYALLGNTFLSRFSMQREGSTMRLVKQ